MYGYRVKINSLPTVRWACETAVSDYKWKNRNNANMLEISASSYQSKTCIINGIPHVSKNNDISCTVGDADVQCSCEPDVSVSTTSVAVEFSDWEWTEGNFTDLDYEDDSVLLLPCFIETPPHSLNINTIKALHNMIRYHSLTSEAAKKAFVAELFRLLYEIDGTVRNIHDEIKINYYIKKINYLLDTHYSKKITLNDIAKELNLSPFYLSAMYKASTGITFSEQLLNVRMSHAEQMLLNQNLPTFKIAELCGFCDESYFRKTFKKFFGLNIKDYRNIKNGITLYHDKPLRNNAE